MIILGLILLVFPLHPLIAEADRCGESPTSGEVTLKNVHIGSSWENFDHEGCDDIVLEQGQVLWHLVLSPVAKDATASIDGVPGENHGGSIHWTFVNNLTSAPSWTANVSNGLQYSGPDCNLQTELRVSHTCIGEIPTSTTTTAGTTTTTAGTTTTTAGTTTTTAGTTTTTVGTTTTTAGTTTTTSGTTTTTAGTTTTTAGTTTTTTEIITAIDQESFLEVLGIAELPYTGFNMIFPIIGLLIIISGGVLLAVKRI